MLELFPVPDLFRFQNLTLEINLELMPMLVLEDLVNVTIGDKGTIIRLG